MSEDKVPKDRIHQYFADYASFHQKLGNQLTHIIGIPMIMFSLLGLLSLIEIGPTNGGALLLIGAVIWYFVLDWKLAVPFGLVALGFYISARPLSQQWLWGLQAGGWAFQFIGHVVFEKKSPAFLKNLEHLLVGPLWVFAKLVGYS